MPLCPRPQSNVHFVDEFKLCHYFRHFFKMTSTAQLSKNKITLKGSCETVREFFGYSINSILFQRGIYPPESFKMVKKYGLNILMTTDERLMKYIDEVLEFIRDWLVKKTIQKFVLVISSVNDGQPLERWQFDVDVDKTIEDSTQESTSHKSDKEIQSEIQAVIRQITASVTFLPVIDTPCTFNLLVYTDKNENVPEAWEESDAKFIPNAQSVRLRSFSTLVHKVDAMVSYRAGFEDLNGQDSGVTN